MNTRYHIETTGEDSKIFDPAGEAVDCCATKEEAEQRVCQTENQIWKTAQILTDIAIKAQMLIHDLDRDTASYWIRKAVKKRD
jgi:hypothetical protein